MSKIKEAIQQAVKELIVTQVVRATVLSVDKEKDTCEVEPLRGGANYYDVRLKAVIASTTTRVVSYPKEGSVVHISLIENNPSDTFVSLVSEIESVLIQNKGNKIQVLSDETKIEGDLVTINGDSLGGIVKAKELKTQIDKNTALLNSIQTAFKSWVVAPSDGGAALKAAASAFINMPRANLSNIENDTIKHG